MVLLLLSALAFADDPPPPPVVQYECTGWAVRSSTGGGSYATGGAQAGQPTATVLPAGWVPVGGAMTDQNQPFVIACRPLPAKGEASEPSEPARRFSDKFGGGG